MHNQESNNDNEVWLRWGNVTHSCGWLLQSGMIHGDVVSSFFKLQRHRLEAKIQIQIFMEQELRCHFPFTDRNNTMLMSKLELSLKHTVVTAKGKGGKVLQLKWTWNVWEAS